MGTCESEEIYFKTSRKLTLRERKVLMEIYKKDIAEAEKKKLPLSIKNELHRYWRDKLNFS
jgi:hypothetical protein